MGIKELRQKWFASYMAKDVSPIYNFSLAPEKSKLFQHLRDQRSLLPEYISKGSIRIVEIGAGAGPNLEYYPQKCHLTVVDPNSYFQPHFQKSLAKCPGITFEGYIPVYAEDMKGHIADNSVDAVVVSAVGCSVTQIQKFYSEIKRILVPGGKFYYIEHIQGRPGSWSYYKQKFGAGIWAWVTNDCRIDRDLDYQITLAGFRDVKQHIFKIDKTLKFGLRFIAPHVSGIATK